MSWIAYPETLPDASGYYYVEYFNPEQKGIFYKAIWYDLRLGEWIAWRRGVEGLVVHKFLPDMHNYYVPCMMAAEERLINKTLEFPK